MGKYPFWPIVCICASLLLLFVINMHVQVKQGTRNEYDDFFFFFFPQWACGSMAPTHICIAHLSRLPLSFSSGKILIKIYIFLYIILSTACMCSVNGIWMAETTLYVEKNRFTALHMNFLFFLFYYQCKSYLQLAFYQNASLIFITFSQHAVATPRSGNT